MFRVGSVDDGDGSGQGADSGAPAFGFGRVSSGGGNDGVPADDEGGGEVEAPSPSSSSAPSATLATAIPAVGYNVGAATCNAGGAGHVAVPPPGAFFGRVASVGGDVGPNEEAVNNDVLTKIKNSQPAPLHPSPTAAAAATMSFRVESVDVSNVPALQPTLPNKSCASDSTVASMRRDDDLTSVSIISSSGGGDTITNDSDNLCAKKLGMKSTRPPKLTLGGQASGAAGSAGSAGSSGARGTWERRTNFWYGSGIFFPNHSTSALPPNSPLRQVCPPPPCACPFRPLL